VICITARLIAARQHSLRINGAPRHSKGHRSMRTIAISLALLSLGSAHAFAETPSDLKNTRADIVSSESAVSSNFASRFDEATAAIARTAKEPQRLRDEAANNAVPIVSAANAGKNAVE
jgi:hypothetical protein